MKTKMAENSKGGILNKTEKFLRRRKTKVLQSLGKTGRTKDDTDFIEGCQRLERQQETAVKLQKDLRNYVHHARAMATASKTFYSTVSEAYEPEWENHAQLTEILNNMDVLWMDYIQKLQDHVQEPLTKYLTNFPGIKLRISKRGRKLTDYDNAKHNLEVLQNGKKKDDAKVTKAQEDLEQAQKIYDDLNNELHQELPEFYDSRVRFYGSLFESLFTAENVFQSESGKGSEQWVANTSNLVKTHDHATYTPRKSARNTMIVGDREEKSSDSQRSDENLNNGHSSGPESPGPSPTSPSGDHPLTNGTGEGDSSKDSIEEYENQEFTKKEETESQDIAGGTKEEEAEATTKIVMEKSEPVAAVRSSIRTEAVKDSAAEDIKASESTQDDNKETEESRAAASSDKVDEDVNKEDTETTAIDEKKPESTVNGDLDDIGAPPPVPSTPPPVEDSDEAKPDKTNDDDDDDEDDSKPDTDNFYEVPPPAKPVDNDLPDRYLYTVVATHAYKGEDDDELTFDSQEIVYVIDYDDPDEQKKIVEKKATEKVSCIMYGNVFYITVYHIESSELWFLICNGGNCVIHSRKWLINL
ncbi:bridging integrator 2-like isoform X2 [Mya arenaria]|uniref:bridging integrator 2-like isoform X2 n=1 Tax=Mya arenaria TaxID=6604 RepID=UPI0022E8B763|nr:bridging integrator 2-like isoform X2 [Mya arenaria]